MKQQYPPPKPAEIITIRKQRATGLTDEERKERINKQKREWAERNKDRLKEKRMAPQINKPNYFGDGE